VQSPPPASPAPRDPALVYSIDTPKIVPPVVVRESLPRFIGRLLAPAQGALEVVIDESGAVTFATMRAALNPGYDKQVVAAAQTWRYRAATLDGVPVKYRKMITVSIVPQ
jgi:hypothetical protein